MRRIAAFALCLAAAVFALPDTASSAPAGGSFSAQAQTPAAGRAVGRASQQGHAAQSSATPRDESRPAWTELTPAQQRALGPLSASWRSLSEAHKRKWLVLSKNYPTMTASDQARLHSRMTEWAALSPQQRTQARLNFAETKKVAARDKKAAWEAYQALPPEEKRKLAAGAAAAKPPPPPTAPAVRPVPSGKLARVPQRKLSHTPGIAVAPNQVDQNTLLPQRGAAPRN
ncbi:MAG TPA: DUF3106 domain-containing protein [Ramlibacter sp.]|uniref:DUF3106 domain-containing protein n=1 Tax=Ramlibacter sp. TaxID=1917967 RepID=UPI002C95FD8F|nr:DUF3106 domain-containing protein [Ramlibacter sp.]HVZ44653.1 DUF3106 domain-containing protein [Ramlibacter sp.]